MIGEKLGPFTIVERIGQGAMGVVYRATWDATGQDVAVKVIHQEQATKAGAAERFERESDILKQFRHPNIVRHIGVGYSRARALQFYAMEFIPGPTLDQVLAQRGPLPWTEVVTLGVQICEALQYAHERGVVHRDLKPSNLLITGRGQVKLTDFGIAKDLDRTALTADGRTLGTAAYMAPEQIRGTPEVSHKTDLYALGCLLYQMLTGEPPFEGRSALVLMHKHLDEPPPRPSARNPEIPLALDKLVVQLMAKDRSERPWDAQAVSVALTELRDKQAQGQAVPMVFGDVPALPTRPGATAAPTATASAPVENTRTSKPRKRKARKAVTEGSREGRRELIGLVAALIGVSALIAYLLWPPSAGHLYEQARRAMASDSRADWIYARDHYLAELDRRFPGHPYQDEVQGWRDRILLGDVERRARVLGSPALTALTEPQNEAEAMYLAVSRGAGEDQKAGREGEAVAKWRAMASALASDPEHRAWSVLAAKRADEVQKQMDGRRRAVAALLEQAASARAAGRPEEAVRLYREVVSRYERYRHLSDLVAVAMAAAPGPAASSAGATESPDSTEAAGFPDTPEGAFRAFIFARGIGDIPALRRLTLAETDDQLAALLQGVPRVVPAKIGDFRRLVAEDLPIRTLERGEELILPDGSAYAVGPEDIGEDRALVINDQDGIPIRVRRDAGRWKVDLTPVLAADPEDPDASMVTDTPTPDADAAPEPATTEESPNGPTPGPRRPDDRDSDDPSREP